MSAEDRYFNRQLDEWLDETTEDDDFPGMSVAAANRLRREDALVDRYEERRLAREDGV